MCFFDDILNYLNLLCTKVNFAHSVIQLTFRWACAFDRNDYYKPI